MRQSLQDNENTSEAPSRGYVASMLSQAPRVALVALADSIVASADGDLTVTRPPQVGTVVIQVREPLARQRFILADALVCNVEVVVRGQPGWAMRLGDDIHAATAAAICEAESVAMGPHTAAVHALAHQVAERQRRERVDEWSRLAPTTVEFEEIP